MIKDLVIQTLSNKVSISQFSEATFTDKYLMPSIRSILLSNTGDDVIYAIIDKPDTNRKRPDFMLGAKKGNKEFFFFFAEVKKPRMKSKYQEGDDFTKLLKQLKTSIDKQLYLGIENPTSLGLLAEGFKCSLFLMTLVGDGIYLSSTVKKFSLVENFHDMIHVPSIVEFFSFVKNELHRFMEKISTKRTEAEKKAQKKRVRPSFITKFQKQ